MSRTEQLDEIIARYDLNSHPFYQDWRAGTLPVEKLRDYAVEYGRFVGTIADGWETVGEQGYAQEERDHEKMWAAFKLSIGTRGASNHPQTHNLVTVATNLFGATPDAYGALYAFEAQQPNTTQSKLAGLVEHYQVEGAGLEYFEVHASDFAEAELLRQKMAGLSEEEFARTKAACSLMCSAMWCALDGIYYAAA